MIFRILLNLVPTDGNGTPPPTPAPATDAEKVTLKGILAKYNNDANAAMIELAPTMASMNKAIAKLRADNEALRAKVPADGAIVVPADRAKLWDAVKDVADDPKEVARRLKEFPTVEAELNGIKSKARVEGFARTARVDGRKVDPEVFAEFYGDLDMVEKVSKDKGTGKEVRTLFVKHKDGEKDVETEFGEFAKKAKPKLLPVLAPRSSSEVDLEGEYEPDDDLEDERPARRSVLSDPEPVAGPLGSDEARLVAASRGRYGR
jgi:hypothetical protein